MKKHTRKIDPDLSAVDSTILGAFILICFLGLMLLCTLEFEDEKTEQQNYCQNVKAKLWPDYKNIYALECGQYEKSVDEVK